MGMHITDEKKLLKPNNKLVFSKRIITTKETESHDRCNLRILHQAIWKMNWQTMNKSLYMIESGYKKMSLSAPYFSGYFSFWDTSLIQGHKRHHFLCSFSSQYVFYKGTSLSSMHTIVTVHRFVGALSNVNNMLKTWYKKLGKRKLRV